MSQVNDLPQARLLCGRAGHIKGFAFIFIKVDIIVGFDLQKFAGGIPFGLGIVKIDSRLCSLGRFQKKFLNEPRLPLTV